MPEQRTGVTLVWVPGRVTLHRSTCRHVRGRPHYEHTPGRNVALGQVAVWPHPKRDWLWPSFARLCLSCRP